MMQKPLIVFDIDGTIADCTHRLHLLGPEPDWERFFELAPLDGPIEAGLRMVEVLSLSGQFDIEFWTGRSDRQRPATVRWLGNMLGIHGAYPIRMRKGMDHREDTVVKKEFLAQAGRKPFIIFEDRASMVQMWRDLGITTYQVAKGDY